MSEKTSLPHSAQYKSTDLRPWVGIKFIYSEKATKFCEISTADLTGTAYDKSTVEISQNFVAFSDYTNFANLKNKM